MNAAQSSFAAGTRAHAFHDGAFVWADESVVAAFPSTPNDQFLIRAANGVGINTNAPRAALHVNGDAAIGPGDSAPRFGHMVIVTNNSGTVFRHPADTNILMTWDSSSRILSVTNSASPYYDVFVQATIEGVSSPFASVRDISHDIADSFVSLTNVPGGSAAWIVVVNRETTAVPGFEFRGSGYNARLNGILTYWY